MKHWRLVAAATTGLLTGAPSSAEDVDCDGWARSAQAWPEVETILRDNYAYLGRVDDPDALLARAGEAAAKVESVAGLGTIAETLGYAFRDGHFHVSPVAGAERAWIPSSSDFWVVRQGERFVVADVRRASVAFEKGLRPGWEVILMDGEPIGDLARAALAPVVPDPSPEQIEFAANTVITGRLGSARSFVFRRHDAQGWAESSFALPPAQEALGAAPEGSLQVQRFGGIAHIRFNNSLGDNATIAAIDAAMAEHSDARALILDLRDTPGGGNTTVARAVLGYFIREPAVYQVHRNAYEESVFGVPRQYAEYVFPRGQGWDRPVVVLAGRWTGSVGEALAMALDRTAQVPTIGTPLADLLGTLNRNQTANNCLSLSFAWDSLYAADGTPREDWEPEVLLRSGESAADSSDPSLEAARQLLAKEMGQ